MHSTFLLSAHIWNPKQKPGLNCCTESWYDHITPVHFKSTVCCPAWLRLSLYLKANRQLSSEEGRRQLRCADSRICVVRRTYSKFGDRCFAAAGQGCVTAFQLVLRKRTTNSLSGSRRIVTICLNCASPNFLTYLLCLSILCLKCYCYWKYVLSKKHVALCFSSSDLS